MPRLEEVSQLRHHRLLDVQSHETGPAPLGEGRELLLEGGVGRAVGVEHAGCDGGVAAFAALAIQQAIYGTDITTSLAR